MAEIFGLSATPNVGALEHALRTRFTGVWTDILVELVSRRSACSAVAELLKLPTDSPAEVVCNSIYSFATSYRQPPPVPRRLVVWRSADGTEGVAWQPNPAAQAAAHRDAHAWLLDGRRRRVGTAARALLRGEPEEHCTRNLCKLLLAMLVDPDRLRAAHGGPNPQKAIDEMLVAHRADRRELRSLGLPDPRAAISLRTKGLIRWLDRVLKPLYPGRLISHRFGDLPSAAARSRRRAWMILRVLRRVLGRGEIELGVEHVFGCVEDES